MHKIDNKVSLNESRDYLKDWWKSNKKHFEMYHGTSTFYLQHIQENGLNAQNRPYKNEIQDLLAILKKVQKNPEYSFVSFDKNFLNSKYVYFSNNFSHAKVFSQKYKIGFDMNLLQKILGKVLCKDKIDLLNGLLDDCEVDKLNTYYKWIENVKESHQGVVFKTTIDTLFEHEFMNFEKYVRSRNAEAKLKNENYSFLHTATVDSHVDSSKLSLILDPDTYLNELKEAKRQALLTLK